MSFYKCHDCPNGNGTIEKDGKLYECMCYLLRRIGSQMPPYVRKAQVEKKHLNLSIIREPAKHYYILASWQDMKAIIKLVMILNSNRYIRITSDREIRDVYVGSKSKKSLGENTSSEILNSLEDLVLFPYIVIIRTNELRYKNKAASGALEEAISIRLDRDKPVWVLNNREEKFGKGSHSWSDSVEELLDTGFQYLEVPLSDNLEESRSSTPTSSRKFLSTPNIEDSESVTKRQENLSKDIFHTISIDEDEEDYQDNQQKSRNSMTFSVADLDLKGEEDNSRLSEYGSGVSKKKKWGRK